MKGEEMKTASLFSTLAAACLVVAPVAAHAAPAQVERSSATLEEGSDLRGVHFLLLALVLAAILAVVLGGKSKNIPVST
jgi:hypothetical protein